MARPCQKRTLPNHASTRNKMRFLKIHKPMLMEEILHGSLPDDIVSTLSSNRTSLGDNPAIPNISDNPFLLTVAEKAFSESQSKMQELISRDINLHSLHARMINKCMELERPIRNHLERLCSNFVIGLFRVPEETVDISVRLVDNVDLGDSPISVDPYDGDEDLQFDSLDDAMSVKGEVYKRRLLDALCMGGALVMASDLENSPIAEEIKAMNPELLGLYKKITILNQYLLFSKEDLGLNDENKLQMGTVVVNLGNKETKTRIDAQGQIFPVLLSELIHGFLELFISHGLPQDRKKAMNIIGKADYLKAEPWDMRLGPSLWKLLAKSFNDINSSELPYLLKRISSLEVEKFNYLMKEVFARTKKGKEIMSYLSAKSKNDIEYGKFVDRMDRKKNGLGVITDDYIHEEEL